MSTPSNDDQYEAELRPPLYYKALHDLKAALGLRHIDHLSLTILASLKSPIDRRAVDDEICRQLQNLDGLNWNDNCFVNYWMMQIVRASIARLIEEGQAQEINIKAHLRIRACHGSGDDHDHEVCSICLNILEEEEGVEIATLDCRHEFHVDCIARWLLTRTNSCPLCRYRALEIEIDDLLDDGGFLQDLVTNVGDF